MAIPITTRKISVALLLLASVLGIAAAPLSVAGQNATEQHLERRDTATNIYAKRISLRDGSEYPVIILGARQALDLEPELGTPATSSNLNPHSDAWWSTVVDSGSGSGSSSGSSSGSWWTVEPSSTTARTDQSSTLYLKLGSLTFFDQKMKALLVGNVITQIGPKYAIHSRLHSEGSSSKDPTPQMRIEAAHAMVERFRTLESFFDQCLDQNEELREKYEDSVRLQAELTQENKQRTDTKKNNKRKAAKQLQAAKAQEGREDYANKNQRIRREEYSKVVFTEVEDWRTGKPVWDEYVQAFRSGKKYTLPPPPTPPT
ncbi:hypothetical protein C8R42DRAFT_41144 [Lentinula raphanica]|nr:hypothetical protein C8R42DRAFT_41144 [Lentinula raphanica]